MLFVAPGQSKAPQALPAPAPSASSARPLQPQNGGNYPYFNHTILLFTFVSSHRFVLLMSVLHWSFTWTILLKITIVCAIFSVHSHTCPAGGRTFCAQFGYKYSLVMTAITIWWLCWTVFNCSWLLKRCSSNFW